MLFLVFIVFDGNVYLIFGNWYMLGLGYNMNMNVEVVENVVVIYYNG